MITRTAAQILGNVGLPPPPSSPSAWSSFKNGCGRYYVQCIRCSAQRSTTAHRNAKVLGVTIDDIGVKWGCNHCNWTGGGYFRSNSVGRNDGFAATYDYHDPATGRLLAQKVCLRCCWVAWRH